MLGGAIFIAIAGVFCVACGSGAGTTAPHREKVDTSASSLTIASPPFVLDPGEEALKCIFMSLPSDEAISVTRIDSVMSVGTHHAILFESDVANEPDGTINDCELLLNVGVRAKAPALPLYLAQTPTGQLEMPSGVALKIDGKKPLMLEMHYLNPTTEPMTAGVTFTATLTHERVADAGLFASYNIEIAVPPHGVQTVSGHCDPPPGGQFFAMTTHAHRFMTDANVHRYRAGAVLEELVDSTDYENPGFAKWSAPFLTFESGEEIYYECSYRNDGDTVVNQGQSATTTEMCMAIGYYFPAAHSALCLNSWPIAI